VAWNVAICAVLALLALAGMEGYLRLTIPPMREGALFEYTAQSKRYKVMKPHADMQIYGTRVRTNALGFRGAEVAAKQPGEYRVVVLGDSMTFGPGIADERLYTAQLEQKLRARHPGVRVLNLAVEGYNILQYEAVLHEVALALEPDLVLVALFPVNDFEMDTYEANRRVAFGEGQGSDPWRYSLYAYRAYGYKLEHVAQTAFQRLVPAPEKAATADGWDANTAALRRIARAAEARGLPLLVAMLPHTKGFETQRPAFARVDAWCAQERIVCLDVLARFRARPVIDGELVLNRIDAHGNDEYHRLVAELIAPHVATLMGARRAAGQAL